MFVTDMVRNITWALRRSRRELPSPESVLPADAVSPVGAIRGDRHRSAAQDSYEDQLRRPDRRQPADGTATTTPATGPAAPPKGQPHIDIEV